MSFKFDASDLLNGLTKTDARFDVALKMFCDVNSATLENSAKTNAKWTDRTGFARMLLMGDYEKTKRGYRLTLSHGVDYGIWLELANEGNYAILEPTIKKESSKVMKDFRGLMNKLK